MPTACVPMGVAHQENMSHTYVELCILCLLCIGTESHRHTCICHEICHLDCSCFFLGGKGANCGCVYRRSSSINMSHKIGHPWPSHSLDLVWTSFEHYMTKKSQRI